MPLTKFDLTYCVSILGEGFSILRGLPLSELNLSSCSGFTNAAFVALKALPLTKLDLSELREFDDENLLCITENSSLKYINLRATGVLKVGVKVLENKDIQVDGVR